MFIEGRTCNFAVDELSMDFCKVCIDAYKASGGATPPPDKSKEKLAQLDFLFQKGELEPEDYIRLRTSLLGEKTRNGVGGATA